jgi:multidrug transporter EmrE-like cation transporter
MTPRLIGWTLVLVAAVLNGGGSLLLKQSRIRAAELADHSIGGLLFSPWFLGGLACYGINVILFAKALEKLPVSVAYPVLAGASLALISFVAALLFHEKLATIHWVGAVIICIGIFLITRPNPHHQPKVESAPVTETPASPSVD